MRRCMGKTSDTGGFSTVQMAVSPNGKLVATGSKMGSVNLFHVNEDTDALEAKPFKTIMNLTTAVTDLKFNSTSEMLAMSSKWKKNSVKIAHIPSYTVF